MGWTAATAWLAASERGRGRLNYLSIYLLMNVNDEVGISLCSQSPARRRFRRSRGGYQMNVRLASHTSTSPCGGGGDARGAKRSSEFIQLHGRHAG